MVEQVQPTTFGPIRFWNGGTAGRFAIAALVGAAICKLRIGAVGYLAILFAGYSFYSAMVLLLGVFISGSEVVFPRNIFKTLPFMVFGRRSCAIGRLDEIIYVGESFGAEWVVLRFGEDKYPVLFASRQSRLAFFEAVEARKPDVRIYRAY